MEEVVIEVLNKSKKPISISKILEKLEIEREEEQETIRKTLQHLVDDCIVLETPNNQYILMQKTSLRKGRFYGNRNGEGKVVVTTTYIDKISNNQIVKEQEYPILKENTNGAVDGDIVLIDSAKLMKNARMAVVEKVLERNLDNIMGEVYQLGNSFFVRPIDKRKQSLTIALNEDAIEGQRVCVSLDQKTSDNFYIGHIVNTFNHKDDPDEDILWEAFKCGIDSQFSKATLEQVSNIPNHVLPVDKIGRMDLTDWDIFTIDGKDTKDIDDAISIKRLANGNYLLGVHIADVSHYVPLDSPLDKDAFKRGTSAYLSGKVIPMLPHELSNGICSLNPGVERLTLSCMMEIDSNGNMVSHHIWKSVISSKLKMCYDQVNDILKYNQIAEEYLPFAPELKMMNRLALCLRKRRLEIGAVEFNRPELKVILNEEGQVCDFSLRHQDLGENLIEEFMLIANETIAHHLCEHALPCLHRSHDTPSEERLEEFIRLLHSVGYHYTKYDASDCCSNAKALQDLAQYIQNTGKLSNMLSFNMVRCMSRAKYSPYNIGHSGLAKQYYCHFTSPIRRYPDLTIHRILKDCWLSKDSVIQNRKLWESKLPEIAIQSSKMERAADEAEAQTLYMRCAEYMEKHLGDDFLGTVVGISAHGLQVQLDNYIEGRVRLKNLSGKYVYAPESYTLLSLEGKDNYSIGDELNVKVIEANKNNKTIDFLINEKRNSLEREPKRYYKKN